MHEKTKQEVVSEFSGIVRYIYETAPNNTAAGYIMFFTVFILCAIVYKLGFARKIKWWQNLIVYGCLFIGCMIIQFFAFYLPMIEGLIVAAIFMGGYRLRMKFDKTVKS